MDGAGAAQNAQPQAGPPQQASLIRFEQVRKLPHLNDQQKAQQELVIQKLWETINSNPQNSPDYQKAIGRLGHISASLMQQMRAYQNVRKQQQSAAQVAQQNVANSTSQNSSNPLQFSQLNPIIQQRVNATQFIYPPAMLEGTKDAENWLKEAKARFGQALQRAEFAKNRKLEIQRSAQQRQQSGNPLNAQETEVFNNKLAQCNKAISESESFMVKFKDQQQAFQRAQPQQRFTNQGSQGSTEGAEQAMLTNVPSTSTSQGPTAHSISSAVSAARSQASAAQAAMSPPNTQAQPTQVTNALVGTPVSQQQPPNPNPSPYNTQQSQMETPGSATQQTHGPPRSLSHQAAMTQSAQSYAAHQQQQQQAQSAVHAHPPQGYLNPAKKDDRQPITKNLQVTTPKPIPVPSARPTLNGGPEVGMLGQMGQPAIPSMPGYVLETSEDGKSVLSKKKLNELVREVCGPGGEEHLTPEVEEIFLSVADEFVDDLVTAACRLAKLRGSSTLDIRDLQLVLERQYNIRVPGFSTDEIRTVRRPQPATGWAQKMSAVQAAKLTGGGSLSAGPSAANGVKDN